MAKKVATRRAAREPKRDPKVIARMYDVRRVLVRDLFVGEPWVYPAPFDRKFETTDAVEEFIDTIGFGMARAAYFTAMLEYLVRISDDGMFELSWWKMHGSGERRTIMYSDASIRSMPPGFSPEPPAVNLPDIVSELRLNLAEQVREIEEAKKKPKPKLKPATKKTPRRK